MYSPLHSEGVSQIANGFSFASNERKKKHFLKSGENISDALWCFQTFSFKVTGYMGVGLFLENEVGKGLGKGAAVILNIKSKGRDNGFERREAVSGWEENISELQGG